MGNPINFGGANIFQKINITDHFFITQSSFSSDLWPDINECEDNNGGCSQECKNRPGSYKCVCTDGFKLQADGKTCKGN